MDSQAENTIYVALGNDLQDGFKTLEWTLKKWNSHPISIIILHVSCNISNDFVYTPFGKLPASAISDEKLEVLKKYEKGKIDKLLSKYISFCGQVKAQLLKVEKCDDPMHKVMIDMISGHRITTLVMGFSFFKSSSWKIKNAINGSFYIHKNKPDYCELFIIWAGKQLSIREEINNNNNKNKNNNIGGIMEDEQGVMFAKMREKGSFKDWLGKIFIPNTPNYSLGHTNSCRTPSSSTSLGSPSTRSQWEIYSQEIEDYFQHLLSLNLDEQDCVGQENHSLQQESPLVELTVPEHAETDLSEAEKIQSQKSKLREAQKIIQSKRVEAKANAERRAKAERAILLCNRRAEELQERIKEEVTSRAELSKDLESGKESLDEIGAEIEEGKSRLSSLAELKAELSNKLRTSTLAKAHSEAQLERATTERSETVAEIEALRRQREVLRRRVEFCRDKDAIGTAARLAELSCGVREFSAEQIRLATNGFSERLRLKQGRDWTTSFRGRINHSTVAIKMLDSVNGLSQEDFQAKVVLLSQIRHPNLVSMVGFCSDLKCIVFEYMHNGSLRDIFLRDILYARKTSRKRIRTLRWHDRIRVAAEVCSGLGFLHMAKPKPIVHGHLRLSNILLDRNLVAKISGFGLNRNCDEQSVRSDIRAFGVLLMHILTGRNWAGLVEAMAMDRPSLVRDLDEMAGSWPLDLAERLAGLALKCLSSNRGPNTDLRLATVMEELSDLRERAADVVARGEREALVVGGSVAATIDRAIGEDHLMDVPTCFLCPIFQEVMKNPHVAADGFSYELEAMEEWLSMGNDTSPMTNLRLNHNFLTPNHTLRTLIQDWHNKRSIPLQ